MSHPRTKLLPLHCEVQHYAWGDPEFIPELLGQENPDGRPYAELWMGAHPDLPSRVELAGERRSLADVIAESPPAWLGAEVATEFGGNLPYLFKVLSARVPLSIQTHPSKREAEEGFDREDQQGIPLDSPRRNYHDRNHKPELIAALTDFWALKGFRPVEEIVGLLQAEDELRELAGSIRRGSIETAYREFMQLPQHEVDAILDPLVRRLAARNDGSRFGLDDPAYWLLQADREFSTGSRRDRGLLSVYLLNLIHLSPGQALQLPAGVLHAYLHGSGVELMANSNNVLRGGLTPKHVDVDELLRNVDFTGERPVPLAPERLSPTESVYRTPVQEFELRSIEVDANREHDAGPEHGPEILLVAEAAAGTVEIASGEQRLRLDRGGVVFAPAGIAYRVRATQATRLFIASTPG